MEIADISQLIKSRQVVTGNLRCTKAVKKVSIRY